jgi:hypothetical protein
MNKSLIKYYQEHGLPNAAALRGRSMGGGGAARGVPMRKSQAGGGVIRPAKRPLKSYGEDSVPIAAKPGEIIANEVQQSALMPVPGREHLLLPEQLRALRMMNGGI